MTPPLVVFALDSADPELLLGWAADGTLPVLRELLARGCHGRLVGPELCIKHGSWTGIYSGLSRAEHGYNRRAQLKPGSYELTVPDLRELRHLPLWTDLSQDLSVAILDAPEVFVVRGLRGVQLTDWATQNSRAAAMTEPSQLLAELDERFRTPAPSKAPIASDAPTARAFLRMLSEQLHRKGDLCRHLLARVRFDLMVIGFSEAHTAGHYFWPYCAEAQPPGQPPESGPAELTAGMREVFRGIDSELGRVLEVLPADSNVFVVSDVGIQDGWPTREATYQFTRALGYEAPRPAARLARAHARLHDLVPEAWRRGIGRALPHRLRERLNAGPLRVRADWSRTTAFALPSDHCGLLRVNLRGREPLGIVEPGADYAALVGRIRSDLEQLVDSRTGQRAVERVVISAEAFGGGPPLCLPDVVIHWAATSHMMREIVHPKAVIRQDEGGLLRRTQHTRGGMFAAAGPGIAARGLVAPLSPLALAPSFLTLMGRAARPGMVGPASDMLAPAARA